MRYLIKNGSIIDPARRVATVGNVLIEGGKVARVIDLADLTMEHEPTGAPTLAKPRSRLAALFF